MRQSIVDFPTYPVEQLQNIYLNGLSSDSVTYDYEVKYIRDKRIAKNLINEDDCFCASTQEKSFKFHFSIGQEVTIQNPYGFKTKAVCLGFINYTFKGYRMKGYFFQYKD